MALWLTKSDNSHIMLIARDRAASGSYLWNVPTTYCSGGDACGTPLLGGQYRITAIVYSPSNAYLWGYPPQYAVTATKHASATSGLILINPNPIP